MLEWSLPKEIFWKTLSLTLLEIVILLHSMMACFPVIKPQYHTSPSTLTTSLPYTPSPSRIIPPKESVVVVDSSESVDYLSLQCTDYLEEKGGSRNTMVYYKCLLDARTQHYTTEIANNVLLWPLWLQCQDHHEAWRVKFQAPQVSHLLYDTSSHG